MNESVDPCDDFYEFACGNHKGLPTLHKMQYSMIIDFVDVLIGETVIENPSHALQIAINYTKSCLNEKKKTEVTEKDFRAQINAKFGGWHLLDNTSFVEDSDWETLSGNLSLYGIINLINIRIGESSIDSQKHILKISTYSIPNERINNRLWTFLPDYMKKFFEKFGVVISDQVIDDFKEFEKKIMNATKKLSGKIEILKYSDFKHKYPKIKWDSIFNKKIRNTLGGFYDSTLIENEVPEFFEELQDVINSTSAETIKNFLMWRVVISLNNYLSVEFRKPGLEFVRNFTLNEERVGTVRVCYEQTREKFEKPLAAYFINKVFNKNATEIVDDMIHTLKMELNLSLTSMDWLESSTISVLHEKLLKMTNLTGYPEFLNNATEINRPYANIKFDPGRYLANHLKLRKIEKAENLRLLKMKVEKINDWTHKVLAVMAHYETKNHRIVLPISISRFPLLVPSAPVAVNYGGFGLAASHEIIHAFDRNGILKDSDGNEGKWFNPEFDDQFFNRTQCLVEQYNREIEPETGRYFDGMKTIDENIADNGGIRIAWKGYQRKVVNIFDQQVLPNMEKYESEKLFFIAYANSMCKTMSKEEKEHYMKHDKHTFGATRVNVPLRNFWEFQNAFNCRVGSKMRLAKEEICRVW